MKKPTPKLAVLVAALLATALARADVNVGVTLSVTGPAASLGIPERNTIALLPSVVAGQKVNYLVLDDASDTATVAFQRLAGAGIRIEPDHLVSAAQQPLGHVAAHAAQADHPEFHAVSLRRGFVRPR